MSVLHIPISFKLKGCISYSKICLMYCPILKKINLFNVVDLKNIFSLNPLHFFFFFKLPLQFLLLLLLF